MDAFVQAYAEVLKSLHEDIFKAVEPLTDAEINWAHPHLSNTIGVLLRHIAGSERSWVVQVVGGRPVQRNRDAEFKRESLFKDALVADLRQAYADVRGIVEKLSAADLTREVETTFRDTPRKSSVGWALLHSLQHTAYHLGQIQLFKKMSTAPQKS